MFVNNQACVLHIYEYVCTVSQWRYIYIYICSCLYEHMFFGVFYFLFFGLFYQFYLWFDLIPQSRVRIYVGKCYFILHVYTFYLMMNFISCLVMGYPLDWHDFSPI